MRRGIFRDPPQEDASAWALQLWLRSPQHVQNPFKIFRGSAQAPRSDTCFLFKCYFEKKSYKWQFQSRSAEYPRRYRFFYIFVFVLLILRCFGERFFYATSRHACMNMNTIVKWYIWKDNKINGYRNKHTFITVKQTPDCKWLMGNFKKFVTPVIISNSIFAQVITLTDNWTDSHYNMHWI